MLGYLSLDIICSSRLTVFLKLSENCWLLGTDNVQGQISEHISAPSGGYRLLSAHLRKIPVWIPPVLKNLMSLDVICSWRLTVFTELSENCSLLGTDNVQGQISEHISAPSGGYCLLSARLRKIPVWIPLVLKTFSVNREAYRKQTIETVLSGFLSVFFFKSKVLLSLFSSKTVENN